MIQGTFFLFLSLALALPVEATSLLSVRLGKHPGKTRMVLDLSSDISVEKKGKNTLLVHGVQNPQKFLGKHLGVGHIQSYSIQKQGNILRLTLHPQPGYGIADLFALTFPNRLVVDIARQKVPLAIPAKVVSKPKSVLKKTAIAFQAFPTPLRKPRFRVIVIDPGHGGKDPGTIGRGRIYEKHVVLAVAKQVKRVIREKGYPYQVILTRRTDKMLPLRKRFDIARRSKADLFISLHADSHKDKSLKGVSIYTLSDKASDKEADMLAKKENRSDLVAGVDLKYASADVANILISLSQRDVQNKSELFAAHFVKKFPKKSWASSRPHRSAGFAVLKAPDVPSVLIELGYLSNKHDRILLSQKSYQKKLASRIVDSIKTYFHDKQLSQP